MTDTSSDGNWRPSGEGRRILPDLLAVLLFLLVLGRCSQELRIGCPDFFWHTKTGERAVIEGHIVWRDDFSHTSNGKMRVPHDWLFDLAQYMAYSRLGMDGVIIGMGLLAATGVTLLYWLLRHLLGLSVLLAVPLAWLFWGNWAVTVTVLRGRVFEALGLLVVLCVVVNWTRGQRRTMLWLVAFFVLWANVHGSFVYGLAVLLWFLASEVLRMLVARSRTSPPHRDDGPSRESLRTLALYVGACVAATFLSAAKHHTYVNAADFMLGMRQWTNVIYEWQPWPINTHGVDGFLLVALVAALCLGRRPVPIFWTALLAGTFWYALSHRRFVPMFAVVALPVMGLQLQSWVGHLEETVPLLSPTARWRQWLQATILAPGLTQTRIYPFLACGVMVFAALAVWQVLPRGRTIRSCTNYGDYPIAIAETVWNYDVPGKMLNEYGDGGYLIFRLWPKQRVFVDGRDRMHGDTVCFDASDAIKGKENWREVLDEYGVTFVIAGDDAGIVPKLEADEEWALAKKADKHRLYLKRCELNADVLRRLEADGVMSVDEDTEAETAL